MTQESQPTTNSETPPVPKWGFKPGPTSEPESPKSNSGEDDCKTPEQNKVPAQPERKKTQRQKNDAEEAKKKFQPKRYGGLSSKARKSIQKALAELSYIRRKKNLPYSIKHFIEESLTDWRKSARSKIGFVPRNGEIIVPTENDPRQTFNNEIEEELKAELTDIIHERGKVGHPVKTMIAILDDAFCQWLPGQEDLPQEYLDAVLQTSQKSDSAV